MRLREWLLGEMRRPQAVPSELAGKWIAWSGDGYTIVASGDSPEAARDAARALGIPDPRCEWVPRHEELRGVARNGSAGQ